MKATEAASKAREAREIALVTEKSMVLSAIKSAVGVGATSIEYTVANESVIFNLNSYLQNDLGYDVHCDGRTGLIISWS